MHMWLINIESGVASDVLSHATIGYSDNSSASSDGTATLHLVELMSCRGSESYVPDFTIAR